MEGCIYKTVGTEEIEKRFPYVWRYRLQDQSLQDSVRRYGILQPLIMMQSPCHFLRHSERNRAPASIRRVRLWRKESQNRDPSALPQDDAKGFLIAGHRRFQAALDLGLKKIPVLEITGKHEAQEILPLSLVSNWNQEWNDLDRAFAIRRLKEDFKTGEEILISDFLPLLGLKPERGIYAEYLETAQLSAPLLDLIADGHLPFRAAKSLSRFSAADQSEWSRLLIKAPLTTNQCWKAAEWLYDLQRREKGPLKAILSARRELDSILNQPQTDGRTKADRFLRSCGKSVFLVWRNGKRNGRYWSGKSPARARFRLKPRPFSKEKA